LNDLRVAPPDAVSAVHDRVPQGKLEIADEPHDPLELLCVDEVTAHSKEGTITHACCDSVAVEHACRELIARRPCVAICMRAALVGFP